MARKKLNQAAKEVIEKEYLNQDPEGFEKCVEQPIPVIKAMPKMETIVFRNDRDPGYPLEFHYASKNHPLQRYTLYHGQEHTLPVEVIEHLESCSVPIYAYRKGPDGLLQMYQNGRRFNFSCKTVRRAA